ncbi:hypothetical protein H5410_023973, partial [Solanum commersonii]
LLCLNISDARSLGDLIVLVQLSLYSLTIECQTPLFMPVGTQDCMFRTLGHARILILFAVAAAD